MNGGLISLSIPYLYLLHVLAISIRVGSTLLFAPIWGFPGLPQYLRLLLVFSIAAGMAVVIPFNAQAVMNPGLVFPVELLIGQGARSKHWRGIALNLSPHSAAEQLNRLSKKAELPP